jgi:hypothetical protein
MARGGNPQLNDGADREIAGLQRIARWRKSDLEGKVEAALSQVAGFDAPRFIQDYLRPSGEAFFALAYYGDGSRSAVRAKLTRISRHARGLRYACNETAASDFTGNLNTTTGNQLLATLRELEERADMARAGLGGTAQDGTRPLRMFLSRLAEGWLACSGSRITWDGTASEQKKDQHPFCRLAHLIFDDLRRARARPEASCAPSHFTGIEHNALPRIPTAGAIENALRELVRKRRARIPPGPRIRARARPAKST